MSVGREVWRTKRVGSGDLLSFNGDESALTPLTYTAEQTLGTAVDGGVFVKATPEDDSGTFFSTPNDRDRFFHLQDGTLIGEQYNGTSATTEQVSFDASAYIDGTEHEWGFGWEQDDGAGNQVLRLFIDGSEVAEATFPATTSVANGDDLTWGADYSGTSRANFRGTFSAIAMTDVLPDATVAANAFAEPNDASVVLAYDMADATATTVPDFEGSNDLTIGDAERATIDTDLFDTEATEAYNRYASHFETWFDDPTGTKNADYPYGQRAQLQYSTDGGSTWTTKQAGFRAKQTDGGMDGQGIFAATFIGYDHFLRREPVYLTLSGVTVSSAIATLIQNHTPVNYDAAEISVVNDTTVTREFKGETPDEVLSWLASVSGDEEYGVDDSFTFFFRPEETTSAPGNIGERDWWAYDLPEESRHAVNSVRVFYGDGSAVPRSSVIVEDRVEQRDLKDSLGASRRVVLGDDVHYPEITDRDAARAKGQEIVNRRSTALTGTVESFQRYSWEPGQVFRLTIPEKSIDDTFAIAEITHSWSNGATSLTIAQNTGNVGDLLNAMSDEITRVDLRDSAPDATYTRYVDLGLGVTVSISASVSQTQVSENAFTAGFGPEGDVAGFYNTQAGQEQAGFRFSTTDTSGATGAATTTAINAFRDAWQGASIPAITDFKVGTNGDVAVQTDTDLHAPVGGLQAVSGVTASGDFEITYQGQLSAGGALSGTEIREVGFFDANGDMHNRATLDLPVTHSDVTVTNFEITFTINTDPNRVGVITNTGQTNLRDLYLGTATPANKAPSSRAYGTGTTAEAETDTALGSKLGEKALTHSDSGTGVDSAEMELLTTEANGSTLAEFGDENPDNDLNSRVTFEGLPKTTDFALVSDLSLHVRPVIL